jgi:hypothetical protein
MVQEKEIGFVDRKGREKSRNETKSDWPFQRHLPCKSEVSRAVGT